MGVLLREVLRTLCVGNQWSYAVFWKLGCHNPRLLIWEECYYESLSGSSDPLSKFGADKAGLPSGGSIQAGDNVGLLIYNMMNHNQFNIVGEGIVGRAAFTGSHEWILANGYIGNTSPPEVLNELHHQFSAGMQTVAVVPVSPHGVVQLGSSFSIMENVGFVNDVKSLILQLGCVPGALLSEGSSAVDSVERTGVPTSVEMPVPAQSPGISKLPSLTPPLHVSGNQQTISSDDLRIVGQSFQSVGWEAMDNRHYNASVADVPKENVPGVLVSSSGGQLPKNYASLARLNNRIMNGAETVCLYDELWLKQLQGTIDLRPGFSQQPEIGQPNGNNHVSFPKQLVIGGASSHSDGNNVDEAMKRGGSILFSNDHKPTPGNQASHGQTNHMGPPSVTCSLPNSGGVSNACPPVLEDIALSSLLDQLNTNGRMSLCSEQLCNLPAFSTQLVSRDKIVSIDHHIPSLVRDCSKLATGSKSTVTANSDYANSYAQASLGDDLYDILGVDYKSQLINDRLNDACVAVSCTSTQHMGSDSSTFRNEEGLHSDFSSVSGGKSDGNVFSVSGTDHLLDAVVSRACSTSKQSSSDGSPRKLFTNPRGSQPMGGRLGLSDPGKKEILELPKYMGKAGTVSSGSWNNESNSCSITTSSYGSPLTSWAGGSANQDSSISVGFPKKIDSTSKTPRKRLKPGENPRPRPKDRQMIQDRVKELREIVPNGAKCSIDALLERTIKHMLFLQSVTKHADKLKQTGDSKLISKEGRLLVNGNFEGGKTWAFEVGSQSTICPIIVEDLNPPRQLLVEMLCEERGFFLEIADLIRGMGLTILKGVMESRNNKIWAQFAVEADRDVTRREVFISLVHLLEQVKSGMASTSNTLENSHMIAHHAFQTAASIPATGMPSMLQ